MAVYTTSSLLSAVRRRGSIPTTTNSSNVNSTASLLELATEEFHNTLLPLIMSTREEWYVFADTQAITANKSNYRINSRAAGLVSRDLLLKKDSTQESLGPVQREFITDTSTGSPQGYYLEHNDVVLYPTPNTTTGTLVMPIYLRPSTLVATTACAVITAIDTGAGTVTVASIPSAWTTSDEFDFVNKKSPYEPHAIDQTSTLISGTTMTFSSLPSDLVVGDYVTLADETCLPQLPREFQSVLAQLVVVRALEALGDREGSKQAYANYQSLQESALKLITPRVHGERKVVIQRNWGRTRF